MSVEQGKRVLKIEAEAIRSLVDKIDEHFERAVELMSTDPSSILGLPHGSLTEGSPADVTVFDPDWAWEVTPDWFVSKSRNSPFIGRTLRGRAVLTISRGEIVFEEPGAAHRAGETHEEDERSSAELPVHARG